MLSPIVPFSVVPPWTLEEVSGRFKPVKEGKREKIQTKTKSVNAQKRCRGVQVM